MVVVMSGFSTSLGRREAPTRSSGRIDEHEIEVLGVHDRYPQASLVGRERDAPEHESRVDMPAQRGGVA
jgi:hypothetical protein